MNQETMAKPPVWFWVVSGLALVWNLLGVMAYIVQVTMSPETLAALPEADQAAYAALPSWYMAAFATAVFAGSLGCLALLLRKKWATLLLTLSFAAVVIQQIYFFGIDRFGFQTAWRPAGDDDCDTGCWAAACATGALGNSKGLAALKSLVYGLPERGKHVRFKPRIALRPSGNTP